VSIGATNGGGAPDRRAASAFRSGVICFTRTRTYLKFFHQSSDEYAVSLLLAIAGSVRDSERRKVLFLSIFSTFVFAILASCGPPSLTSRAPLITFAGTRQVHHQRETVTAKVQPALASKEFLQIWVRADDNQWYPCAPAKPDPTSETWNAVCQFGSDQHPAPEGAQFVLGAFYTTNRVNSEYLPDSVWYLLKTQQTKPVLFSRNN
jgi:hypothetical protein